MPIYEYLCKSCGPFNAMRPMAEYELPLACPRCDASAPRVLLTAPSLAGMPSELRLAHATNERSAHAPRTLSAMKGMHGAGCACCSGKTSKRAVRRGRNGTKSFPTSRPWMISH
jgi:putative FmdB family regulatory protein